MTKMWRKVNLASEQSRWNRRLINGACAALLIIAVFLLFSTALNSHVRGLSRASSYPDAPRYDSVPVAFTVSFDPQRVKRMTGESYRVILPVKYAVVPQQNNYTGAERTAPCSIGLPLLVASPKSYRQSCLLVDIPPPSF
ncbi:MAG: hypothetical protein PHR43_05560 [Dehalococcoidales bacterium]|nr:hypothetical protein [Dehalococcoidales bacterium]